VVRANGYGHSSCRGRTRLPLFPTREVSRRRTGIVDGNSGNTENWAFANPEKDKPDWPGRVQENWLVPATKKFGTGRIGCPRFAIAIPHCFTRSHRPQRATGRESQTHTQNRLQTRGETIRTPCEHRPRQPTLANVADRPVSPRCTPAESLGPERSPDFTPANRFRSPRKPSVVCNLPFSSRSGPIPSVRARSAASNTVRFCL
jgi:hypothetical protein